MLGQPLGSSAVLGRRRGRWSGYGGPLESYESKGGG